jgi:hypothetical protein
MRAIQSVDIFRRELIAEIEIFCEAMTKEIVDVYRESDETMQKANDVLARNALATKRLLECLNGERPMRAVIKYIGTFVREKVEYTHREIEALVKLPQSNILL